MTMCRRFSVCALAIALLLPPTTGSATPTGDVWASVDQRLAAEYPANGPGAYAIVARGDKVLFSRGYGLANVELNVPLTSDSVIRIASLTKQFTAVAILKLAEQGKLGLDDPLDRLLPDCPAAWRAIRIRQLLNQTSGLTDTFKPILDNITVDMTPDQLLALYSRFPLDWAPGTRWRYANLNYWILGKVIETVSGQPYAAFVQRNVLMPTMTRTRYGSHDDIILGRAQGYEAAPGGGWSNARYFSATLGYSAGGFLSTPVDMAAWYAALARARCWP